MEPGGAGADEQRPVGNTEPSTKLDTIRVITQNLLGYHQDWPHRRPVLASGLGELRPDLVLLQEAVAGAEYDMVTDLLGDGFRVSHPPDREPDGSGISIASRWPIGAVRELD